MSKAQVHLIESREVKEFVTQHGIQTPYRAVLDHLPSLFPDASKIKCELEFGIGDESDPRIVFLVSLPDKGPSMPTPFMKWSDWAMSRFSGRVLYHFTVLFTHEP